MRDHGAIDRLGELVGGNLLRPLCLRGVAALLLLVATARPGWADIVECPPGDTTRLKIFLSDIWLGQEDEASAAASEQVASEIYLAILGALDRLKAQGIVARKRQGQVEGFDVIRCPNRRPSLDGRDFTRETVEALNSDDVLLEIWGEVRSRGVEATAARITAGLAYLLVPIGRYDAGSPLRLQNLYHQQNVTDVPGSIISWFGTQSANFEVFAATTLGVKQAQNRSYDEAHKTLCSARIRLSKARADGQWAQTADPAVIDAYIADKLQTNLQAALNDPDYAGALKAIPEALAVAGGCQI